MEKMKVAVLISGRGSNMGALARAAMDPDFPAEIVLVLSNRPHVGGLELAQEHGIPIKVVDHKEFETRELHENAIDDALKQSGAELVCLAGYMRILGESFVSKWKGQMINVHPSLLPSFRGIETHERALERGVRLHGCTVHFVTGELDGGPIIAQTAVQVHNDDDADTLAARVLEAEHQLYPHALCLIATQKIRFSGDAAVMDGTIEARDVAFFKSDS